jgi:4-amino-4-deoxy-L-arabinose transferase-like glycosyltransferase
MDKNSRLPASLFLLFLLILFVISRVGYLNLPFYWDEAWSYAVAVLDMHKNGPVILPGDGNPELTRGHPLLFYFLSASWARVFGTSLVMVHLFSLMISVLLLAAVYFVAADLFDQATAYAATLLFALQSIFLAQSTLLLPEVMLALWSLLTTFAYFRRKWALFAVFSVLLVMTKETGMVLIGMLFLDKILLERIFNKGQRRPIPLLLREIAMMSIPVMVFAVFIILQKIRSGWFLYPEHLDLAILDPHEIINRIRVFLSKLLFLQGRNIFFISALAALAYGIFNRSIEKHMAHLLLFSAVFIMLYVTFSSVNFFTVRYLLSVFPFFIIPGTWLITVPFKKNWLKATIVCAFALLFGFYALKGSRNEQDTSLGVKNTVLLQKEAVNFAEEMHWQEKSIYTAFLMQYYLSIPDLGYLNNKAHPFTDISNAAGKDYEIFVFCSNEKDPLHEEVKKNSDFLLVKRFERKGAWVEFYKLSPW